MSLNLLRRAMATSTRSSLYAKTSPIYHSSLRVHASPRTSFLAKNSSANYFATDAQLVPSNGAGESTGTAEEEVELVDGKLPKTAFLFSEPAKREDRRQAIIKTTDCRVSPWKMNVVAKLCRNRSVEDSLLQMRFLNRKASPFLIRAINAGIKECEQKYGLRPDQLMVAEATVSKGRVLKRLEPKAKGRSSVEKSRYSHLFVTVRETRNASKQKVVKPQFKQHLDLDSVPEF